MLHHCVFQPALSWLVIHHYILSQYYFKLGQCLTHTDCPPDQNCVLKPLTNRSGKFAYSCVPEQGLPESADREDDDRGGLQKVPEVEEPEREESTTESPRPKSKFGTLFGVM